MSERLKVQIFRDSTASSELDTSIVYDGLKIIDPDSELFDVVNDDLEFPLTNTDDPMSRKIRGDTTMLPLKNGAFNYVLTDKALTLSTNTKSRIIGYARIYAPDTAIALINNRGYMPAQTVAHETGHMVGVSYGGHGRDTEVHCDRKECLMHSTELIDTTDKRNHPGVALQPLSTLALEPSSQTTPEKGLLVQSFCTPCKDQLAIRAFALIDYIAGRPVPKRWFEDRPYLKR